MALCGSGFCTQLLADCKAVCNNSYYRCSQDDEKSCAEQIKEQIQKCLDKCLDICKNQ